MENSFKVTTAQRDVKGRTVESMMVTFGENRMVEVERLSLSAEWALLELTGSNASNGAWSTMASVAASVRTIDGVPVPGGNFTRDGIGRTLDQLGVDGFKAALQALNGQRSNEPAQSEDQFKAAVGNS